MGILTRDIIHTIVYSFIVFKQREPGIAADVLTAITTQYSSCKQYSHHKAICCHPQMVHKISHYSVIHDSCSSYIAGISENGKYVVGDPMVQET